MRHFTLVVLSALLAIANAHGAPRPTCAGRVEIAHAYLHDVEKNGTIILTNGRSVQLEGIRLPGGALDKAPWAYADQAQAALRSLASAGPMTLTAILPKADRYGRLRAQVFSSGIWFQGELLKRGLARVAIAPDRTECASELFDTETKARTHGMGLWADRAYAIRAAGDVWPDIGSFQLVEGRVLNVSMKNGRAYLNFGDDWRRDFTATVDPDDMDNFRRTGVDPLSYLGQTIRVRGWVQRLRGPEIEIANPQSIEVMR